VQGCCSKRSALQLFTILGRISQVLPPALELSMNNACASQAGQQGSPYVRCGLTLLNSLATAATACSSDTEPM
jgi:hypothetical protein